MNLGTSTDDAVGEFSFDETLIYSDLLEVDANAVTVSTRVVRVEHGWSERPNADDEPGIDLERTVDEQLVVELKVDAAVKFVDPIFWNPCTRSVSDSKWCRCQVWK